MIVNHELIIFKDTFMLISFLPNDDRIDTFGRNIPFFLFFLHLI